MYRGMPLGECIPLHEDHVRRALWCKASYNEHCAGCNALSSQMNGFLLNYKHIFKNGNNFLVFMYTSSTCFKTWTYVLEWEHTEHCEVSILEHWNLSKGLHTNHIDKFYIYWHSCKKLPTIIRVTHNNSLEPQLNISLCQISSWKLLWATSFISLRNRCEWT
jgi:hypothetical protein